MGDREKLYLIGDDTHTLTIGATRSGKTRCLVIQSICSIALSGESLVISDPKAELYHYTADYLKKLAGEGKLVIISTHIMSEAEKICDRIGVVIDGKKVAEGRLHEILQETGTGDLEDAFFELYRERKGDA